MTKVLTVRGEFFDFLLVLSRALHVELVADVADQVFKLLFVLVDAVVVRNVRVDPDSNILGNLNTDLIAA